MVDEHFLEQEAKGWWRRQSATTKFFLRAIIAFVVVCIIVAAVNYTVTPAKADEPCAPSVIVSPDLPSDLKMICHTPSGEWGYDSAGWTRYLRTGVRCLRES